MTQMWGYLSVTFLALEAIPLATTEILLVPASAASGTSKVVVTIVLPVAMPMLL